MSYVERAGGVPINVTCGTLVSETRQILDTFFDNTKNDRFMCVNYYVYRFSVFVFIQGPVVSSPFSLNGV